MKTLAYDPTGNRLVAHDVFEGDQIEWKRNGTIGFTRCWVLGVKDGRLKVRPIDDEEARACWISTGVRVVYDASGKRKGPSQ